MKDYHYWVSYADYHYHLTNDLQWYNTHIFYDCVSIINEPHIFRHMLIDCNV